MCDSKEKKKKKKLRFMSYGIIISIIVFSVSYVSEILTAKPQDNKNKIEK